MKRTRPRRVVAAICIAALFFAVVVPTADALFCAVLVPLPVLFGAVLCLEAPQPQSVIPSPTIAPSPLPTRAPPA